MATSALAQTTLWFDIVGSGNHPSVGDADQEADMNHRMKSGRPGRALTCVVAGALLALAAGAAVAAPDKSPRTPCFYSTQWNGWKSPSPKVIYLGVNMHDVYQLDLAVEATRLQWSDARLISEMHGSSSICSALDMQLYVSDTGGMREPLFPSKLTKLTPEEVAAIPKKFLPN